MIGFGRDWSLCNVLFCSTLFGLGVILTAEGMQLFLPERVSLLCDVVCNTLGAAIGGVGIWVIGV